MNKLTKMSTLVLTCVILAAAHLFAGANEELFNTVPSGDINSIKGLIDRGADVNHRNHRRGYCVKEIRMTQSESSG